MPGYEPVGRGFESLQAYQSSVRLTVHSIKRAPNFGGAFDFYRVLFLSAVHRFGWDSWIRTNEMTESKSVALPLGYIPIAAGYKANGQRHEAYARSFVGWVRGIEPMISGTTIRRFNLLSYTHRI